MNALELRRRTLGKGVYKKTVEGNPAIAQDSLARMYPGITMQGWTEQDGTPTPEAPVPIVSAGKYNEDTQKYEYQVKLTGKNLWDKTNAADKNKWVPSTSQTGYSDFAIDVATGQSITVSFPEKLPTGLNYYVGIVLEENGSIKQWMYHPVVESLIHQWATVVSTGNKIWIRCATSLISNFVSESPLFQVEYGLQRTEYAPYQDQTVTLTTDRPLTKWDRLEKRDGVWGWVHKSDEIKLDGSEDWRLYTNNKSENLYGFQHNISNLVMKNTPEERGFIDKIPSISRNISSTNKMAAQFGYFNTTLYILLPREYFGEHSVSALTEWLSENPLMVLYETEEETFVPLSESEQEAMNALYTFRPTTVLSNDCDCNMSLTYKTKKSLEVTT